MAAFALLTFHIPTPPNLKTNVFAVREEESFSGKWQALISDPYPDTGRTVPELASKRKTSVAVNANFYSEDKTGIEKPIGLVVHEGELLSEPRANWPSVGFWGDKADWDQVFLEAFADAQGPKGRVIRVHLCRLNGSASLGCASLWTHPETVKRMKKKNLRKIFLEKGNRGPKLGTSELDVSKDTGQNESKDEWVLEMPQNLSKEVLAKIKSVKFDIKLHGKRLGDSWVKVREAVSGSHLISAAETLPPPTPASRNDRPWALLEQPRTVLGQDDKERIFVAVFDGRSNESAGVSVNKAWEVVHDKLHAKWMLNLDGGGSTTLVYRGKTVNAPSSGVSRAVAVGFGAR